MAINSFSIFYFGLKIEGGSNANNILNFLEPNEGNVELAAEIDPGTYTYAELLTAIKTAMDAVGNLDYTLTVDRSNRIITFTSTDTFELLAGTGSQIGISPFSLLGYSAVDKTGASTYDGDSASGDSYSPQFKFQDFDDKDNFKDRQDASVNVSASGEVEVIFFGLVSFYNMSFKFITSKTGQDGKVIKNNPTGLQDAQLLFQSYQFLILPRFQALAFLLLQKHYH